MTKNLKVGANWLQCEMPRGQAPAISTLPYP